jgi:hypothetical protein
LNAPILDNCGVEFKHEISLESNPSYLQPALVRNGDVRLGANQSRLLQQPETLFLVVGAPPGLGSSEQTFFVWRADLVHGCPENCGSLVPMAIWIDPGWLSQCFVLSNLPAFLASVGIVRRLARLAVSEIPSFFVSMPLLTLAWCYFVGRVFDRWRSKRART